MTAKDVLKSHMDMAQMVLTRYLADLSDADLMRRPAPTANHLAWQLGHLINSENGLVNMVCPGVSPALPAGFADQHGKGATGIDDPGRFLTKQQYLELFAKQREATKTALAGLADADLDKPGPDAMKRLCPTVGSVFVLIGNHPMMHAGQFATVRRILGKPIVI
jgi:hypothetical protein